MQKGPASLPDPFDKELEGDGKDLSLHKQRLVACHFILFIA